MRRNYRVDEGSAVSEVAIVDTFTKLIFGEEADFSARELSIIHALRLVECRLDMDRHKDLGTYLRALGVAEMISLVGSVRNQLLKAPGSGTVAVSVTGGGSRTHPV